MKVHLCCAIDCPKRKTKKSMKAHLCRAIEERQDNQDRQTDIQDRKTHRQDPPATDKKDKTDRQTATTEQQQQVYSINSNRVACHLYLRLSPPSFIISIACRLYLRLSSLSLVISASVCAPSSSEFHRFILSLPGTSIRPPPASIPTPKPHGPRPCPSSAPP